MRDVPRPELVAARRCRAGAALLDRIVGDHLVDDVPARQPALDSGRRPARCGRPAPPPPRPGSRRLRPSPGVAPHQTWQMPRLSGRASGRNRPPGRPARSSSRRGSAGRCSNFSAFIGMIRSQWSRKACSIGWVAVDVLGLDGAAERHAPPGWPAAAGAGRPTPSRSRAPAPLRRPERNDALRFSRYRRSPGRGPSDGAPRRCRWTSGRRSSGEISHRPSLFQVQCHDIAAVWIESLKGNLSVIRDYAWPCSAARPAGWSCRSPISSASPMALSVADFGLFATASATGIVLSRIAGFGFVSPLYRVATVRNGWSAPIRPASSSRSSCRCRVVAIAAAGFYLAFFCGEMACRPSSPSSSRRSCSGGCSRSSSSSTTASAGSCGARSSSSSARRIRAVAAVIFAFGRQRGAAPVGLLYAAANAVAALVVAVFGFYPRQRLRFRPALYLARWRDSLSVAGAEIVFYLQSELDKLLVLSLGGPEIAGIYAILMRLIDLTALPIRSANTMIVQKLMKTPHWLDDLARALGHRGGRRGRLGRRPRFSRRRPALLPAALGGNVADAAPLVLIALFVPAFRNLIEYESELLYARGRTGMRALILAIVGADEGGHAGGAAARHAGAGTLDRRPQRAVPDAVARSRPPRPMPPSTGRAGVRRASGRCQASPAARRMSVGSVPVKDWSPAAT